MLIINSDYGNYNQLIFPAGDKRQLPTIITMHSVDELAKFWPFFILFVQNTSHLNYS
ncbi:hypothetical protein [Apilactobacillus kunkeei]|uniref:hypothetical protein n=1 Tax=Apilactobacillus kunkeei TaxID=148814 RepID=UPI00177B1C85|nr:hypothetical protein [Apilactobacillus kunkeei]